MFKVLLRPASGPTYLNSRKIFTKIKYVISIKNNEIFQERLSVLNTKGDSIDLIAHEFEGQVANQYVSNLGSLSHINAITEVDNSKLEKRYGKWQATPSMFHILGNSRDATLAVLRPHPLFSSHISPNLTLHTISFCCQLVIALVPEYKISWFAITSDAYMY